MSSRKVPHWLQTPVALGFLLFTLAGVAFAWAAAGPQPGTKEREKVSPFLPAFPRTEAARNPVTLQLQADEHKVVGWVSGTRDHSGKNVLVKVGDKAHELTLDKDNSFTWEYRVAKSALADLRPPLKR